MISIQKQLVAFCDCPCDDLVDYKTPKMMSMALSYIAQAVVLTIVGLNMGLRFVRVSPEGGGDGVEFVQTFVTLTMVTYNRKANLDIWKKLLKSKDTKVSAIPVAPGMSSLNSNEE
jgi:hypothetical protein